MNQIKFTKLCTLLFLSASLLLMSLGIVRAQHFNQRFPKETLADRIKKIKEQAKSPISFDARQVQDITVGAFDAVNCSLTEALDESLKGTDYNYQYRNEAYIVYKDEKKRLSPTEGKLQGTVLDEEGRLLPGASINVVSGSQGAITNIEGQFSMKLPVGNYTLEVAYIGYQSQKISGVKIIGGKTTPMDIKLDLLSSQLDEIVVTATYNQASAKGLYAKQKAVATMSDGVSADLIKKTGDSNLAQVLKRVSGVTVDKGKYVIVRGMSERYNNVQLNGANLPSTEPNRRNFSFNVIPTGLVDNVTIAKTFTPDLPGEFTGGLVRVNTLALPRKKTLKVSVGTAYNTISTGKKFLTNKRFKSDWLFGEVDSRKWYQGRHNEDVHRNAAKAGELNTYGFRQYKAMPKQSYKLVGGVPFSLGKSRLGIMGALTYSHSEDTEEILEAHKITRDSLYRSSYLYKAITSTGAMLNAGWQIPKHKILCRSLFNNRFSHRNSERFYHKYYEKYNFVEQYSRPLKNTMWQTQLDGKHTLYNWLIVSWNASYNKLSRTNPDDRLATGLFADSQSKGDVKMVNWLASFGEVKLEDGHIMYSGLNETKKNAGVDVAIPFNIDGNMQQLKFGYLGNFRNADFQQHYLSGVDMEQAGDYISLEGVPLAIVGSPKYFMGKNPLFKYVGVGDHKNGADYYEGSQKLHAAYLMGEFSFFKKLRLIAGARMEKNDMKVNTVMYSRDKEYNLIIRDSTQFSNNTEWLPSATLVYSLTPKLNLRAAYSKTLARPDFREMTNVKYYNVDDRVNMVYRYILKTTLTENIDARIEWYPKIGEVVSLSYFYKKFKHPVENIMRVQSNQQNFDLFVVNLDGASSKGIEFNFRKSLGFVAPSLSFLKDFYFLGNYMWMKANVAYNRLLILEGGNLSKEEKENYKHFERERPLQGLSPYSLNLGLAYDGERIGAAVNYNRKGRKLVIAGEYEKYDQYENPRDVMDIQLSARFLQKKLELKFNASDILNQDYIIYRNCDYELTKKEDRTDLGMDYNEGDWVMRRFRKGINLSFSVGYTF